MQSIIPQGKVHFYEYLQVQLLRQYIQKGLTYFIKAILNSSPKFVKLRYFSQQIALVIDYLKDFYYLLKYKATYAQYFFDLQRQNLFQGDKKKQLSKLKILIHAAIMTIIPYICTKIEAYYNQLVDQQQHDRKVLNNFQSLFTKIYPYINTLCNIVQVALKFRFILFQKVKTYDLYYKLSNTELMYMEDDENEPTHLPVMEMFRMPGLLVILIGHKVLAWYFNQNKIKKNEQNKISQKSKYISPMSAFIQGSENKQQKSIKKKFEKNICPICSNTILTPTVVKQTGHVYCYKCISNYIKENQLCPLTNISLILQNLQLIYQTN